MGDSNHPSNTVLILLPKLPHSLVHCRSDIQSLYANDVRSFQPGFYYTHFNIVVLLG